LFESLLLIMHHIQYGETVSPPLCIDPSFEQGFCFSTSLA